MYVELSHVSFAFAGGDALFEDVSVRFERGVTALVGENGAGKSTLLALIEGALWPERGSVRIEPADARVMSCPQGVDVCTEAISAFAERSDSLARRLIGQLALDPASIARWATLSPGERRRFQLATALADEPDVLLLDEPTNHVDEDARLRIQATLARFGGVCILVSHDRSLIDALAARTVRVHAGSLRSVQGGYEAARKVWSDEAEHARSQREGARRELAKVERKLKDARRVQASSERSRSTSGRMRNANDSDARTLVAGTLADWASAKASRNVSVLRDRAEDARLALADKRVTKEHGRSVFAHYEPCPRPRLLSRDEDVVRRDGEVVLRDVPQLLERDAKVRIRGPNGAGKSTLLRALAEAIPERDRVLYLPQELDSHERAELIAWLRGLPRDERGRVLDIVAALGVDPDRLIASNSPSHGEARKLLFARGLSRGAWALLLDEPTNHLDLPSVERLEAALADYPGALVVVSHDPRLLERTLTRVWTVENGIVDHRSI